MNQPKDFRMERRLPWSAQSFEGTLFDRPSTISISNAGMWMTLSGYVLFASGLVFWLPYVVWRSMRGGWISHLGALLLLFLIVAVTALFLGQTFTVPFLQERPEWFHKLGIAFLFAPLWGVIYVVPLWIWRGAWWRCLTWALLTIVLSAAIGGLILFEDQRLVPFLPSEHYVASWSPALLMFGVFAASWLGALSWGASRLLKILTKFFESFLGSSSRIVSALKSLQPQSQKVAQENAIKSSVHRRPRYARTLYLWGIAAIALWIALCPDWNGISYRPDGVSFSLDFSQGAVENGSFGLSDEGSRHYLWDPPVSVGGLPTSIRWPWQFVSSQYHIELDLKSMLLRFISALAAYGGLLFVLGAISANERRDPAWFWVSLMTLLWVVVLMISLILQVFTMGYLPTAFALEIMFLVAWIVGYFGSRWLTVKESVDERGS